MSAGDKNADKDKGRDRRLDCSNNADDRGLGKLRIVALTDDGTLACFTERSPEDARKIGPVVGLIGDTTLVGIDFRVQDGLLYGVGNAGGVYTIDIDTAAATLVNRLSVLLTGTSFGVDFNPAADRLRIVSDIGQNLRHNVNVGGVSINDVTLTYTAAPTLGIRHSRGELRRGCSQSAALDQRFWLAECEPATRPPACETSPAPHRH